MIQAHPDSPPSALMGATPTLSINQLRERLSPHHEASTVIAVLLLLGDIALFIVGQYLVLKTPHLASKLLGSILTTVAIIRLFILGHDACHGSLTPNALLNKILGRIAFLPSLTPYSLWRVGHNVVHHGFNNLRGRDFVWQPLDQTEYQRLSRPRQWLERIYRSAFGPLPYYLIEIWWRRLYFPRRTNAPGRRLEFTLDSSLVTVFAILWGAWIAMASTPHGAIQTSLALLLGLLLPFLVWVWVVGFVIYLHHTHPEVVWYDDKTAWMRHQGMLHGTVRYHVHPWWNLLLHNIMEHAAHHLDARIPLYRLKEAQAALALLVPDIPVVELSMRTYLRTVRACKLYDYKSNKWTTFPRGAPA